MPTKEYMQAYLADPEKKAIFDARSKEYENKPETKAKRKAYRKARQTGGYFVYYLPAEHYCGIATDLTSRISWHKHKGKNTDNYKVLFHSFDKKEAAYNEALFQSVLAIEGLNVKLK